MNYCASFIVRDGMPASVMINLDLNDDDSMTDIASKNKCDICLVLY